MEEAERVVVVQFELTVTGGSKENVIDALAFFGSVNPERCCEMSRLALEI